MPPAQPIPLDLTDEEREDFWSRVATTDGIRECWEWTSTRQALGEGHGRVRLRDRYALAHRVAYVIAYGVDPGASLVLHSCDNLICVNPRHLRLGTQADNGVDKSVNAIMAKVRAVATGAPTKRQRKAFARWAMLRERGMDTPVKKRPRGRPGAIGDEQAQSIRFSFWAANVRDVAAIASAHACPVALVRRIVARRGYAHLDRVDGEPDAATATDLALTVLAAMPKKHRRTWVEMWRERRSDSVGKAA